VNTYSADDGPPDVLAIEREVMPRLLDGDSPFLETLRLQYARAEVESVELSGVGFFVNYRVPSNLPKTSPPSFAGGNAELTISGLDYGAGCVVFVGDGHLSMFEVFIYESAWPVPARLLAIDNVMPAGPPDDETRRT
jgi:hypothetical protein